MEALTFKRDGQEYTFNPLDGMTKEEILELIPEAAEDYKPKAWSLQRVTKAFKAVDLRRWAKDLGFSSAREADAAQALIDNNFDFDKADK